MLAQKPPGVRVAMRDSWTVLVHASESADAFGATHTLAKLAASLEDDDDDDDAGDDDLDDDYKPPCAQKEEDEAEAEKGTARQEDGEAVPESKKKAMRSAWPWSQYLVVLQFRCDVIVYALYYQHFC